MCPFLAARLCCYVVFSSVIFLCCSLVTVSNEFLFVCSLKDIRHSPSCCALFTRAIICLFPICTRKDLRHPPAVEIFHVFLPFTFFMFGSYSLLRT